MSGLPGTGQPDPVVRQVWVALLYRYARFANRHIWEPVLEACLHPEWVPELVPLYLDRFAARDIDGPDADAARQQQQRWNERAHEHQGKRIPHAPPLPEQVDILLTNDSLMPEQRWSRLLYLFDLDLDDARYGRHKSFELDLTKTPLWEHLSDDVREDLIAAASAALPEMVLSAEEAIPSENRITTRALATLNAASLSYGAGTFGTAVLSDDAIIGLVTASLAYPFSLSETADAAFQLALQAASDHAPVPLRRAIEAVLASSAQPSTVLSRLLPWWHEGLAGAFLDAARVLPEGAYERDSVIDKLIQLEVDKALSLLLEEVAPLATEEESEASSEEKATDDVEARRRWRSTAAFLLAPERTWALIGPRFESDDDFARRWLRSAAARAHEHRPDGRAWPNAPATLTGHIYRRFHQLFPPSHDPQRPSGVGYSPTAADNLSDLRWAMIGSLTSRASLEDLDELRRLQADLPDADLRRAIANAEDQHRRLNPAYPEPAEVLRLAANPDRLPIRSDAELQQAVLHALEAFQQTIAHQEQPEAATLWERAGQKKADGLTPRDENYVSDRIAAFLRRVLGVRGITVTRESEVARGSETDLRIEAPPAPSEGRDEAAVVVVEVKGSWNQGIPDSMRSQLAHRYLLTAGRRHGIYLVVDFDLDEWSETTSAGTPDARRTRVVRISSIGLRQLLEETADELMDEDYVVKPVVIEVPPAW